MASPTHRVTRSIYSDGRIVTDNKTYTGSLNVSVDTTDDKILAAAVDQVINIAIDVSELKSIIITSDEDITIETNNTASGSADDILTIVADVPYIWTTDDQDTCLLTVDVTVMYCTNAGATDATLKIEALIDATP